MSKLAGKLIGLAVAAAGVYVIGKYIHDYTDYKAAGSEDLDGIKKGGADMKEAVARTYVAIRQKSDVKTPAEDFGHAVGEVAAETGKLINTVGNNTASFVKSEKEKYELDPKAYREEVAGNFKDMGNQAVNTLNNLKEDAIDVVYDIKDAAMNLKNNAKDIVEEAKAEQTKAEQTKAEQTKEDNNVNSVEITEDTEKLN